MSRALAQQQRHMNSPFSTSDSLSPRASRFVALWSRGHERPAKFGCSRLPVHALCDCGIPVVGRETMTLSPTIHYPASLNASFRRAELLVSLPTSILSRSLSFHRATSPLKQ